MQAQSETNPIPKSGLWTSRILGTIAVLFLLFDSIIHLMVIAPVVEAFNQLGLPLSLAFGIGIIETLCLVLYVVPSTSVFGAILLTGYLGGATAIQLRIGAPLLSTALFPIYVGVLVWGALYLRDPKLRALVPFRRRSANGQEE